MTYLSARLFDFLQGASFYEELHQSAANMIHHAPGQSWLDVGCGPGLLTRIAAKKRFSALGIDLDAAMVQCARQNDRNGLGDYAVQNLEATAEESTLFDVVSASSLLVTSREPKKMLQCLKRRVRPGGKLLLLEASSSLTMMRSIRRLLSHTSGKRGYMLLLWAATRSGKTLPQAFFEDEHWKNSCTELLDGMVNVWLLERPFNTPMETAHLQGQYESP
jgi:ubiquinone/menaquinone biosynthesis C-methylase UbiE